MIALERTAFGSRTWSTQTSLLISGRLRYWRWRFDGYFRLQSDVERIEDFDGSFQSELPVHNPLAGMDASGS